MKYIFTSQRHLVGSFEIESESPEDALDELRFELECHDTWTVIPQDEDFNVFKVFLKGNYVDTLIVSEIPETIETDKS